MSLLTEFTEDLGSKSPDWCVTRWVLDRFPYAFHTQGIVAYWEWRSELARRLEVDAKNVVVTGSAAVGVSLNPFKHLRPFGTHSDIDVAVVSTYHFEVAWRTLRTLGSRYYSLTPAQKTVVSTHRERYVYWGAIATDRILAIFPFAKQWTSALDFMSKVEPTIGRDVSVRIYRDVAALRAYLREGLRSVREKILEPTGASEEIPDE